MASFLSTRTRKKQWESDDFHCFFFVLATIYIFWTTFHQIWSSCVQVLSSFILLFYIIFEAGVTTRVTKTCLTKWTHCDLHIEVHKSKRGRLVLPLFLFEIYTSIICSAQSGHRCRNKEFFNIQATYYSLFLIFGNNIGEIGVDIVPKSVYNNT